MELDLENEKVVLEKDGNIYSCDILATFDSDDTKKSYVLYTDHSISDNGKLNIYVSSYNPLIGDFKLTEVTDSRELAMVDDVIKDIQDGNI